jgi:CRP-like cAMP-binding protein
VYERELPDIRRHYLRTWFVSDLISSLPLDLLFIPWGFEARLVARFTRFLRFAKYDQYFQVWEQYSTRAPQAVRFLKLMLGLTLMLHWLGCFWFWCGYEFGFGASTWLPPHEFKHAPLLEQYVVALWWSTNIITQVGGDPGLPSNTFERISDFIVSFIAVFVVAVIIGNVTELVSELSADAGEMRAKLSVLNNFMYARRLPEELQTRIRNYYFALWSRRGVNDEGSNILQALPTHLRTEVSLIMNQDILGKVPIFQSSSPGFINALVLHLRPQTYIPGEFIVRQGDMGSEMFFISRGSVHVIVDNKLVLRIGEGGFFGEICVIADNAQRTASIQAINFCDVFVLSYEDLQTLFKTFPLEKQIIMHVAETRRAKDLLRKVLQDPQLLAREGVEGFTDPTLINKLIQLFQPLDLSHMTSQKNAIGGSGGSEGRHVATVTMSGLKVDEHGEILFDSDEEGDTSSSGESDPARSGLLFSPEQKAEMIYFIGKGCVDIFAHAELEAPAERGERRRVVREESLDGGGHSGVHSDAETDSNHSHLHEDHEHSSDDESDPSHPQHVIRLTEGHFFGCISSEHFQVSAVLPEEYRDEAIIFVLPASELGELHEYYNSLPEDDEEDDEEHGSDHDSREHSDHDVDAAALNTSGRSDSDAHVTRGCARHRMKKSLVTWLQRLRTPLDYVKSMLSPSSLYVHQEAVEKMAAQAGAEGGEQKPLSWKVLLKVIMSKSLAAQKVAEKRAAASGTAVGPIIENTPRRSTLPPSTDREEKEDHHVDRRLTVPVLRPSRSHSPAPARSINSSPAPPPSAEVSAKSAALVAAAVPSASSLAPVAEHQESRLRKSPEHMIIVSPAGSTPEATPPGSATEPKPLQLGSQQWESSMVPPSTTTEARAASRSTSPGPSSVSAPAVAAPSGTHLISPPSSAHSGKPDLHRSVSVGAPSPRNRVPQTPFSPLASLHARTGSVVTSAQDVSELLAAADIAANNQQRRRPSPLHRRTVSISQRVDEGADDRQPLSGGGYRSARMTAFGPDSAPVDRSPSLEWLTGGAAPSTLTLAPSASSEQKETTAQTAEEPEPLTPGQQAAALRDRPDVRRVSTGPVPQTPQMSSSHVQLPRNLNLNRMSGGGLNAPFPPLSGRQGRGSLTNPAGQPFSFLLSLPPTQGSGQPTPAPLSPLNMTSPAVPVSHRLSGTSPASASLNRKHAQAAAKRAEFLEKALAALSAEELLLLANKANMHLYTRMQQASAQALQLQQAAATDPPPISASAVMRSASAIPSSNFMTTRGIPREI